MPVILSRRNFAAVATVVLVALGAYLISRPSRARSDPTQLDSTATAIVGQIAAFRQGTTSSDVLPSESTISGTLTRRVGDVNSTSIWATIDNGRVCIQDATGANVCLPVGDYAGKPLVMAEGKSPTPERLVGLVPDGIRSVTAVFGDGSIDRATVVNNGFQLAAGQPVKEIRWTTPNNVTHSQEW